VKTKVKWSERPKVELTYEDDGDIFYDLGLEKKETHKEDPQPLVIYHGKVDEKKVGTWALIGLAVFGIVAWAMRGSHNNDKKK